MPQKKLIHFNTVVVFKTIQKLLKKEKEACVFRLKICYPDSSDQRSKYLESTQWGFAFCGVTSN